MFSGIWGSIIRGMDKERSLLDRTINGLTKATMALEAGVLAVGWIWKIPVLVYAALIALGADVVVLKRKEIWERLTGGKRQTVTA